MLAVGRALMTRPKLLLLDEPSMGLAPMLIQQIFEIISEINSQGTTVLVVEQNAQQALRRAHRAYVLETGRIVKAAPVRNCCTTRRSRTRIWASPDIAEVMAGRPCRHGRPRVLVTPGD